MGMGVSPHCTESSPIKSHVSTKALERETLAILRAKGESHRVVWSTNPKIEGKSPNEKLRVEWI